MQTEVEAICRKFLDSAHVARQLQSDRSDFTQFPKVYTIPNEAPWPDYLQGETLFSANLRFLYKMDKIDQAMLDEFDELKFVWDPVEHQHAMSVLALKTYRALNGHVRVPGLFVVPDKSPLWAKDLWNMPLGVVVKTYRSSWTSWPESTRAALEETGLSPTEAVWPEESQLAAFKWFKQIYGHVDISGDFVVPSQDAAWPQALWGLPLGLLAFDLQANPRRLKPEQYSELRDLGVVFEGVDRATWDERVQALIIYWRIYGDFLVPSRFKVPRNDVRWPDSMWDLGLGGIVSRLRRDAHVVPADRFKQLKDMGFVWNMDEYSWGVKIKALQTYKALHGDLRVPQVFNIPTHDSRWPKETRGFKLGRAIDRLREHHKHMPPERVAQLSNMGFVWRCRRKRQQKPKNPASHHATFLEV
ncbi:hypothetical protein H310_00476 [Aphanomyces invadans]|uniref:Helicase-associated domain-containing protein n=1 Tax=Aphanomyces invadans TaxID=157072 RepID=A0A024UVY5_9STRA|nr:hypothetical protein H310_00476 [Aphanomyces invadans]ETW10092.1 hypothetical protein H310_00476 [Aphanomyces invadans]|eukprot:XP_008861503.1 hypothetical protein H310_00476 [Aphanomyces invadans]